jgi:hypothetical protein
MADAGADPHSKQILNLARRDRDAARARVASLAIHEQVRLICESGAALRPRLLGLVPEPDQVIPMLPEAELCFSIKAAGLQDAAWIVEHATDDQLQACLDLDLCSDLTTDREQLNEWLGCFAEAGDESLLRILQNVDPELQVLWLCDRLDVVVRDADPSAWQAPPGAKTVDGVFYLLPRRADDDLAVPLRLLTLLFSEDRERYERLLQAARYELTAETEEAALRWREARLQDLGFPPREEALAIYAPLPEGALRALPEAALRPVPWHLPVWAPRLPSARDAAHSVLRAAAGLDREEQSGFFFAYLALANKVARADRLALGDAESIPAALEKVAVLASYGLDELTRRHAVGATELLGRVPLEFVFRVGVTLDRGGAGK